ncbi:MAG: hypothetical protein EZS28_032814 [Streblomastix strix]|uniref:Uncharacterized protein n=2 Tax=Streblomastix strix TaxID=222440 RepID=A0A5J4UMP2_9EUKA|nr:MAG: hypothetical protein EZS28_032814 [Streblomastix strix]
MKGNAAEQLPARQQCGDKQEQHLGNPNQIQQGQRNRAQQGEAPKQGQQGQQTMHISQSGNVNNQEVLLKQQIQIVPVQNDQFRYLYRKGGEKMVCVSRYLDAKIPYDYLFLHRDITIVGHRLDFGGRLAAKIENLLIDNIEAGLQVVQNTSTIMISDTLLEVLIDVHHQLEKDSIVHTSWSDLISSVKGRCSATSLSS